MASERIRFGLLATMAVEGLLLLVFLLRTRRVTNQLSGSIRKALLNMEEIVRRIAEGRFQEARST